METENWLLNNNALHFKYFKHYYYFKLKGAFFKSKIYNMFATCVVLKTTIKFIGFEHSMVFWLIMDQYNQWIFVSLDNREF